MNNRYVPKLMTEFRIEYDKCISEELQKVNLDDFETSYGLIVTALTMHDKLTMKELAHRISRDKSTVTVLVRKLESKGYVKRLVNPSDHRSHYIALTDKTIQITETLDTIGSYVNKQVWQDINEDQIIQFMSTLHKMTDNLRKK